MFDLNSLTHLRVLLLICCYAGRDSAASILPLSFHFRLPRIKGAIHRPKSAHDDALRSRHREGKLGAVEQGLSIQVSLLSERVPSERC